MRRMSYDLIVFWMAGGDGSWRDNRNSHFVKETLLHVCMNAVTKDVIEGYYIIFWKKPYVSMT